MAGARESIGRWLPAAALLLLGSDALATYREVLQGRLDAAGQWEELTRSTDFDA